MNHPLPVAERHLCMQAVFYPLNVLPIMQTRFPC